MRLRLSDNLSYAIEFDADSAKALKTGIRHAWQEWRKQTGDKHRKQLSLHIYDERQKQWWAATPKGDLTVNDMFAGDNDYSSMWQQVVKMDKYLEEFYGFIDPIMDETMAKMKRQRREEAKQKFKIVSRRDQGKTDS